MSELVQGLQDMQRIARLRKTMLARENLLDFIEFTSPDPEAWNDVERSTYKAAAHHRAICQDVQDFLLGKYPDHEILILTVPPRHGKQLDHDTPVPTPSGWVRHGDLRPGDYVFSPSGTPARVEAIGEEAWQDCEVEFTNGEAIRCHARHEWVVRDRRNPSGRLRARETQEMEGGTWIGEPGRRGSRARWQLLDAAPLHFPRAALPLHPYALGVWLGDGSAGKAQLTGVDEEVFAAVAECTGYRETGRWVHATTGVTTVSFSGARGRGNVGQMSEQLRALGVFDRKRIPGGYLRSSREQRMQLLAGLMDTDGHAELGTGRCRIVTCSPALAGDIRELVDGLGFRGYVTTQAPALSTSGIQGRKVVYTVGFQPTEQIPARLARKRVTRFAVRRRIAVRAVRRVEPSLGRCIQVEGGVYLCGRSMLPTHNSEIVSRRLPAWLAGKFPTQNIVVGTYNDDFAADFGDDVRRIIQSKRFKEVFPTFALAKGGTAKDRLKTTKAGQLSFVGRGGSLTGRGAHVLVLDDIIKDDKEAASKAIRDSAWNWFARVAMTRRMGDKRVIITFTRWNSDDPIGRLTDPENEFYSERLATRTKIINLPAIAEQDDPLGREPGEALWPDGPDRFDEDFLAGQQALDPIGFSSLYQQRPTVEDGILFRRENVHLYEPGDLPEDLRYYCASDHAVTTEQRSDYSCLVKVGVDRDDHIWLVDAWWQKARTDVVVEAMLTMGSGKTAPLIWWAEKGHISKSIGPFLKKRMVETGRMFNLVEVTPIGDKEQRAQSISARMALGRVHLPAGRWWTDKAVNELLAFPNGRHDDFVDAMAYIGLGLRSQVRASPVAEKKKAEPRFGTYGWIRRQQRIDEESLIGKGF